MPYRFGSQWSSQRQEGRVFRFLPPVLLGTGSLARGLSGSRPGAVSGSPVHLRGHGARLPAEHLRVGCGATRADAGMGHPRRASDGYLPWRGQTPREHRLTMDLNPPRRVSNAMVDESLEDGELTSRPSTFGRFLLISRGAGLPWEASGSVVSVLSLSNSDSEGGLHLMNWARWVMSACHIYSHANQRRSKSHVLSLRGRFR
jgi:hypothetical protein